MSFAQHPPPPATAAAPQRAGSKPLRRRPLALALALAMILAACGGEDDGERRGGPEGRRGSGPSAAGGGGWGGGDDLADAAVPVEVAPVVRRTVSAFLETNGTLEAENEVDVVARLSGPLVLLAAEEGQFVRRGDLLARIDPDEVRSQRDIALVEKNESQLTYERLQRLYEGGLVSLEQLEQARARAESASAQLEGREIQLAYTEIRAPFAGQVVERYVKRAQNVSVNTPLFRISDFDPLLCPIQVPERELSRLRRGQEARLEVEAWPGETFSARVLRISPVIAAATGTVEVTLEVDGGGKLRPGMFASVYLETDSRDDALVIPFAALALDRLGDSVYVVEEGMAVRQAIELGFREGDAVEVTAGLAEGDQVVVVGQDGLADGTPVAVLGAGDEGRPRRAAGDDRPGPDQEASPPSTAGPSGPSGDPARPGRFGRGENDRPSRPAAASGSEAPSPAGAASPEERRARLDEVRERMRQRGLSEDEIEERIERFLAERRGEEGGGLDAAQIERMRRRMTERGLTPEQIEQRLERLRQGGGGASRPSPSGPPG